MRILGLITIFLTSLLYKKYVFKEATILDVFTLFILVSIYLKGVHIE